MIIEDFVQKGQIVETSNNRQIMRPVSADAGRGGRETKV